MKKSMVRWVVATSMSATLLLGHVYAAVEANRASPEDLMAIKGIGPATSQRIVEARDHQAFTHWNDFIQRVRGIGPTRAARLSEQGLRVNGQPFENETTGLYRPPSPQPLWVPIR